MDSIAEEMRDAIAQSTHPDAAAGMDDNNEGIPNALPISITQAERDSPVVRDTQHNAVGDSESDDENDGFGVNSQNSPRPRF